jgi:hypothetical protein
MLLGNPKPWTLEPDDDPCQGGEMAKGVGLSGSSQRRRSQHWGELGLTGFRSEELASVQRGRGLC